MIEHEARAELSTKARIDTASNVKNMVSLTIYYVKPESLHILCNFSSINSDVTTQTSREYQNNSVVIHLSILWQSYPDFPQAQWYTDAITRFAHGNRHKERCESEDM